MPGHFEKNLDLVLCLRLVAQTLLMTIGLHALATLVLVDLGFPAFLE